MKSVRREGSRIVQRESGTPVQLPGGLTLPVLSGVLELGWLFRDAPPLSRGARTLYPVVTIYWMWASAGKDTAFSLGQFWKDAQLGTIRSQCLWPLRECMPHVVLKGRHRWYATATMAVHSLYLPVPPALYNQPTPSWNNSLRTLVVSFGVKLARERIARQTTDPTAEIGLKAATDTHHLW